MKNICIYAHTQTCQNLSLRILMLSVPVVQKTTPVNLTRRETYKDWTLQLMISLMQLSESSVLEGSRLSPSP